MHISLIVAALLVLALGSPARADSGSARWPARPITFVTPAPPGGPVDIAARISAEKLAKQLSRPVVVDSRPGADGIIAAQAFLTAKDPEHAFLVTFGGVLINNPVSYETLPYDSERDFVPVSMIASDTVVICAQATVPAGSLRGLADLMREHPKAVRWASAPGEPRLRFFGLLKLVDAQALHVPYKSTNQAVADLVAGRLQIMAAPLASVLPNVRGGSLKLLAVMADKRSAAVPDVPSAMEAGFPGLSMRPFIALFARSGIDTSIVERMNREMNATLADPEVRRRLTDLGLTPEGGTPAALGDVVRSKLEENRRLAQAVGTVWK